MKKKLSKTENKIALWMERGHSPAAICAELAIAPSTLRVHQRNIRLKGAAPTRRPGNREGAVTAAQRRVLQLIADGFTHEAAATALRLSPGTTMNHVTAACRALGITSRGLQRVDDIRAALGATGKEHGPKGHRSSDHGKLPDDPIFD